MGGVRTQRQDTFPQALLFLACCKRCPPSVTHTPLRLRHLLALLSGDRVFKLSLIKDDLYNRSVVWHL